MTPRNFAWQAWRLATPIFVSRGMRGAPSFHVAAYGIGLGLVARLGLGARWSPGVATSGVAWRHPPTFCVAGVALGDIHLHFAWQAWNLATSTYVLRRRCGTYGTGLGLVARFGPVARRGDMRRGTW